MSQTETRRVHQHLETLLLRRSELRTLLLVEDDPLWVDMAALVFQKFNCVVDLARTAEQALEFLKTADWNYRAVFIDNGLPAMDGIQLLKRIKELKPQIMCIVVSGFISEKLVDDCKDCGVVLIRKPITIEAIRPILAPLGINERAV